jgi:signal transduction histidine kinase
VFAWWRRRGLRARLTLVATLSLAAGIAATSFLLITGFAHSRIHAIDDSSHVVAANIASLAGASALPEVLPVQAGQSAQVLSPSGAVIAVSPGTLRTLRLLPLSEIHTLASDGPQNRTVDSLDGQGLSRVLVRPVSVGRATDYVVVAESLADEQDTIRGLTRTVLIVAPVLLLVVAATMWLLIGRALDAVTRLRRGAESITDPANGDRLPLPASRDEIHQLAETLNAMLDRLAAASLRERAFVADAAHELRSPLAAMRTQLEVLIATSDPLGHDLTEGALEDAERLTALVQDLLALARIDAGAPMTVGSVDLAQLAQVPEQGPAIVCGDQSSLSRAIGNLVDNAHRHARGRVEVTITQINGQVELHVDDDGPGVPPGERVRVFERFVRLDAARTRTDGGSGLGLAIVQATALAHGGSVMVRSSPMGGARFTLVLPTNRATNAVGH